ncbi:ATP-binding protein [Variovorax boronicumulans]
MINTTLNQLRTLRQETMAQALEQQLGAGGMAAMSFEERLALLADGEVHGRQGRRCARVLKMAKPKYSRPSRGSIMKKLSPAVDAVEVVRGAQSSAIKTSFA